MVEGYSGCRSSRVPGYDYSSIGAYFVTICTAGRQQIFGQVLEERVRLSPIGKIANDCLVRTEEVREEARIDSYVIMPNHVHFIVFIDFQQSSLPEVGATGRSPLPPRGPRRGSLGALVGGYKADVTTRVRRLRKEPEFLVWQRNYYEKVIRTDGALNALRRYIRQNPQRWDLDGHYVE